MLKEYLIKKVLDTALDSAKGFLKESGSKLVTTREDIQQSINYHLRSVKNWSGEVSFNDLKKAKRTTDIYIELDLYVMPRRRRINADEIVESIPLKEIFESSANHFIVLGQPGAGKTTSLKFLCQTLFLDEDFQSERFAFPILIKFRDLKRARRSKESSIIDQIFNILGLKLDLPKELTGKEAASERREIRQKLVINLLEELRVLLMLDGFDELPLDSHRYDAIDEIAVLATHLDKSTMVVTSRTGDFVYNIENAVQYELSPLSKEQIHNFAIKWIGNKEKANDFLKKVYDSPFSDTAIRPLTLAHLCAIYERIGTIPDKPKTVYRKIINLLLEEWDQQRSIKRYSKYANFEVDRKFDFLSSLAFILTKTLQSTVFSTAELLKAYNKIYEDFDLSSNEAEQIVSELESHTGLLIQSGYEQYEFAHKSLQEFLAAEYLVKLPSIPESINLLVTLPNELAIAVTISSRPSEYFSELVLNRLIRRRLSDKQKLSHQFMKSFLNRLLLEKPDFNTNPILGLSLVFLYTLYVEFNVVSGNQLRFFYVDRVVNEFEKLMTLVLRKSSIEAIRAHYETDFVYHMDDLDDLHRMVKKAEVIYPLSPIQHQDLPEVIYIRPSILDAAIMRGKDAKDSDALIH